MSTTQLFAELLVIGTGVVLWLAFLFAAVFQIKLQDFAADIGLFTLAPIVAIAYVLGIVMDRLAYSLFSRWERRIRSRTLGSRASAANEDRERYVLTRSEELGMQANYNRSRLRICRSWAINFLLIGAAAGWWGSLFDRRLAVVLPIAMAVLSLLTLYVWTRLAADHYVNIRGAYDFLQAYGTPGRKD